MNRIDAIIISNRTSFQECTPFSHCALPEGHMRDAIQTICADEVLPMTKQLRSMCQLGYSMKSRVTTALLLSFPRLAKKPAAS
jgi:hypothetical protein